MSGEKGEKWRCRGLIEIVKITERVQTLDAIKSTKLQRNGSGHVHLRSWSLHISRRIYLRNRSKMGPGKQVALIVGASRGIGRQVAIDLARNGYAGIKSDHYRKKSY